MNLAIENRTITKLIQSNEELTQRIPAGIASSTESSRDVSGPQSKN